jgi:hypothetical protein
MIYLIRIVHIISDKGENTMNITISFDVEGYTNNDELVAWLNAAMVGGPIKVKRTCKPRKPMTDERNGAFHAQMVKGKEEAANAQDEEKLSMSSMFTANKTTTGKVKTTKKN